MNTGNRFYAHRKEIAKLSNELGIDADNASVAFAKKSGWVNYNDELKEWRSEMVKYQRDKKLTLADLFA